MAGFIPVILGSGAYATIRAMAPSVVEKFIRTGIKGFRKVPANKLNSVPKNLKKVSESQARKIIKPTPSRQGPPPKVTRSKKSPTPSRQGPPPKVDKPKIVKPEKTTREFYEKAGFKKSNNKVPAKRSNTNLTKKPESKMKLALNKNKKTGKLRDGIIPASMAAIVVGDTLRNKKSNNNAGTATAKTQKKTIAKPITQKKPFVAPKAKDQEELNKNVKAIPRPSSPFGPVETRVRNKFIKDRGGKDAFKSDKQIDSLFVNEMFNMREGSEGGYTYDDQKDYEAILEERKSRKKVGGKVSKKVGGKVVKRSMGGSAKPKKKVVFRRGGGKALRGFGKATYSKKMY